MEGVAARVGLLGLLLACVTTAPTNKNRDWDIYSFHVNSTVTSRYATTIITSRVANRIDQSQEIEFHVKIPKNAKVTFELTYEELLKRRLGKYELLIHARPMQPVADFKAWVHFYPSKEQQSQCDSCGEQGLNGDLVIVYDVYRNTSMGDLKESKGYFVHHFAPSDLPRIPKNVVFIIDRSGSMHGRKMEQTREALLKILVDLVEDDHFGLITFDYSGTAMLNRNPREGSASLLILLTDGDPTTGETNLEKIHKNVKEAIGKKFPLYCLGFGMDVNFEFLEKMALENSGVGRRIYEDSDAALQLQGFYEEVATPLLTDVQMVYVGGANLTQTNFSQYYNGSEIVVSGQITDNNIETFTAEVIAISTIPMEEPIEARPDSHIQRLWAYLTVKQLLDKDGKVKEKVKKEALDLCLKYGFVTPLTSMVVTKPQGEASQSSPEVSCCQLRVRACPLCYDIPVALSLRLLKDPNNELSINGQLGQSASTGYQKIVIHYKSDQHIELDTTVITFKDGQNATYFSWSLKINHKTDSVSLILRDKEMDITIGSIRVIIMLYEGNGIKFLWPVLRQRPAGDNIVGIMARPPVAYEEVQGTTMKLKIKDKEIDVSRDSAVDLSVRSAPTVACWLLPLQSALQGELADFTVTQL
ncbi:unnamed protein product [Coregonus sp. 'balchen']|nr:unnamed protein product [Coregonus sp. 'balchen']